MDNNTEIHGPGLHGHGSIGPDMFMFHKMALIGQLLDGIAHDIRNPLGVIVQGADCLDQTGQAEEHSRPVADMIKKASSQIGETIEGILNFAQPSSGPTLIRDVAQIIEESLALLRYPLSSKHITVEKDVFSPIPGFTAERNDIKHAVLNVMVNAIDAVPERGVITIGVRQMQDQSGGNFVAITITDNGSGIPEGDLYFVSEPFFTTRRDEGRIGLGLTITRDILEKYNGYFNIENAAGKGTRVVLALPAG